MKKLEKSMPVIRFKGFSEAWEQRKLEDILDVRSGRDYKHLDSGDIPVYGTGGYMLSVGEALSYEEDAIGIGRKGTIDKPYILKAPFWTVDTLFYTVPKRDSDLNFIHSIFQKINWKSKDESTGVPSLSKTTINAVSVFTPSCSEQKEIGTFFNKLDDTIALHQRKLDALKLMKKGFLQQMFPKRGENIPKIRLDDFDDIWEQRILGEFLKESKIKGSNGSLAKKLTVKLWRKGVVPKEEIYTGSSATQYYIRKTGQFIYGKLDFLNQAFGIIPLELDGYESTLDSPAFDIEESINETFLLEYVSLVRFYKYQGNIANGSRRAKRIHTDTFFEMPIPLPNSNEQQKIGTFSQQIDDLIALQQNKLEKISSLKRFYL
ncbi:TPA: restriction endonuclease subunit S, partial [Listeria monocytogenes]|nr:restriction endonuclease subunit S [Listeria monocytogenes]